MMKKTNIIYAILCVVTIVMAILKIMHIFEYAGLVMLLAMAIVFLLYASQYKKAEAKKFNSRPLKIYEIISGILVLILFFLEVFHVLEFADLLMYALTLAYYLVYILKAKKTESGGA